MIKDHVETTLFCVYKSVIYRIIIGDPELKFAIRKIYKDF